MVQKWCTKCGKSFLSSGGDKVCYACRQKEKAEKGKMGENIPNHPAPPKQRNLW
jgi:uncharacterized Zn finger protein (UPF0148 family)